MAYKQSPLAYSRTSNMPGLEYSEEDLAQKERIASNALGITPPADLLDGEFFLKDNDPQDFYRTLYIKRGESLDKVVTFTDTGKAIFDGINIVNLDDDEEVTGVLPKKKIITAAATVQIDNISTIIGYDGNKFQELKKNDFVNKVVDDVNAGIDLANYFNKETDILDIAHGGHGNNDGYLFSNVMTFEELRTRFIALGSTAVTTEQFINAIADSTKTAFKVNLVSAKNYISDCPLTNAVLEVVRLTDTTIMLTAKDLFVFTTYEFRKSPDGQFSGWKKTVDSDGSIPIAIGGTGTTVGALPFSSRVKAGIVVSDDFSIDLNVGDLISILFKGITKEQIIQTYVQNGTYLLHWFRQRKDTKELSDNNSIVKVVTPSTKTDTWNGTYEGMCNIIRIK